jgi:hypothetical protein
MQLNELSVLCACYNGETPIRLIEHDAQIITGTASYPEYQLRGGILDLLEYCRVHLITSTEQRRKINRPDLIAHGLT